MMIIKTLEGEAAFFQPDDTQSAYNWGVLDERARIIKLLKSLRDQAQNSKISTNLNVSALIALLKQEN